MTASNVATVGFAVAGFVKDGNHCLIWSASVLGTVLGGIGVLKVMTVLVGTSP